MDIFNNREIAVGIWILIFSGYAASNGSVRTAIPGLLKSFFRLQILASLTLMIGYIVLIVFGLSSAKFWDMSQLKNTIFWGLTVAFVSMFHFSKITEDVHYFINAVKDNFKLVVILEFVIAFHTFPLFVELLVVPVASLLVLMQIFVERGKEYSGLAVLIEKLLIIFGGVLITYAGYMLVTESKSFFQAGTLTDFALPIVLTLLFLPFLYMLALYACYEKAFLRINFLYESHALRRHVKRTALCGFHIRTTLLRRWLRYIQSNRPSSQESIKDSVRQVRLYASREKNPPLVPISKGWSPYLACKFLNSEGLEAKDYHHEALDKTRWYACSSYLEMSDGLFPNNIVYYVEGDEYIAHTLKLVVNFNEIGAVVTTRKRFTDITEKLIETALHVDMPPDIREAINAETSKRLIIAGKTAEVVKELWPNGQGYKLIFYLRR